MQSLYFIAFIIDNICVSQTVSVQCMYSGTQYSMLHGLLDPLLLQREMVFSLSRIERKDASFFHVVLIFSAIFNSFSA